MLGGAGAANPGGGHLLDRLAAVEQRVERLAAAVDDLATRLALRPPSAAQSKPSAPAPCRQEEISDCDDDDDDDDDDGSLSDMARNMSWGGSDMAAVKRATLSAAPGYTWSESIWDAATIIGNPSIGAAGSWLLAILLLLNLVIQLAFCYVSMTTFTEDPYNEIVQGDLQYWRYSMAHQAAMVDAVSGASLASRLCGFDGALGIAGPQQRVHSDISGFGSTIMHAGPMACTIALLCWYYIIADEVGAVFRLVLAMMNLPRGRTGFIAAGPDDGLIMESLSARRAILVCSIQVVRLIVAFALGAFGARFLICTATAQALVTNAVALHFVMETDELLFKVAAPNTVRVFMSRLKEVPLPHVRACKGINLAAIMMCIAPLVACYGTLAAQLRPVLRERNTTFNEICGGITEFAVTVDGLGRAHWSSTMPFEHHRKFAAQSYLSQAVSAVMGNDTDRKAALLIREPSVSELVEQGAQSVAMAGVLSFCKDSDTSAEAAQRGRPWQMGRVILQTVARNASVATCADVVGLCFETTLAGIRARQWCPETCGCSSPSSGLVLDEPSMGCPRFCTDEYIAKTGLVKCSARTVSATLRDPNFKAYLRGIKAVFVQRGWDVPALVALADSMAGRGCQAVADGGEAAEAMCEGSVLLHPGALTSLRFRSVRRLCPVACGCDGSGLPGRKRHPSVPRAPAVFSTTLQFEGECDREFSLASQYHLLGTTENRAPAYRSSSGYFMYYGPDCVNSEKAERWIVSPALCAKGFADAFVDSWSDNRPPEQAEWIMRCTTGWQGVNVTLYNLPDAAATR